MHAAIGSRAVSLLLYGQRLGSLLAPFGIAMGCWTADVSPGTARGVDDGDGSWIRRVFEYQC
ncbi:MAG: hypothetical protein K0Q94_6044 [Paenibacillus sp.]|jgi:hypothetical protein|nr:hypothetical protein [Paenibacillus sp.]